MAAAVAAVFLLTGCSAAAGEGDGDVVASPTPTPEPLVVDWPLLSGAMPPDDAFAEWGWALSDDPIEPMSPTNCEVVREAGMPATPTLLHERAWSRDGPRDDLEERLYVATRHYAGVPATVVLDAEARVVDCPPAEWEIEEGIIRIHAEASETAADYGDAVLAYRQVYETDYARVHQEGVIIACGEVILAVTHTALPERIDPAQLEEWAGIVFDAAEGLEGQC